MNTTRRFACLESHSSSCPNCCSDDESDVNTDRNLSLGKLKVNHLYAYNHSNTFSATETQTRSVSRSLTIKSLQYISANEVARYITSGQSEVSKLSLKYAKVNKKRRTTLAAQNAADNIEFSNVQDKNWPDLKSRDLTLEEILDLESNKEVTFHLLDSVFMN